MKIVECCSCGSSFEARALLDSDTAWRRHDEFVKRHRKCEPKGDGVETIGFGPPLKTPPTDDG